MRLPVRTTLLQNVSSCQVVVLPVRLPVRTTLLQNIHSCIAVPSTVRLPVRTTLLQNDRAGSTASHGVRLPVRTTLLQNYSSIALFKSWCDYQPERHCSKTAMGVSSVMVGAITSQNDTAPKRVPTLLGPREGAITSQNDTAPKHCSSDC